jgi:hypothetical protein
VGGVIERECAVGVDGMVRKSPTDALPLYERTAGVTGTEVGAGAVELHPKLASNNENTNMHRIFMATVLSYPHSHRHF